MHTDVDSQQQWLWWSGQTKLQRDELDMRRYCVYLGDLQQYNTVLDGLYHALKEKDWKCIFNNWQLTSKLKDGKENVLSSDLHK